MVKVNDDPGYLVVDGKLAKKDARVRGFEPVSGEQWTKDTRNFISYGDRRIPKRATAHSAGYDIFSPFYFKLEPGEEIRLPLGFKAYMQPDEFLMFVPRSSLGFKYFLRLANTVGIGDSDYYNNPDNEGHYWIKMRNEGDETLEISAGTGIGQAIFQKYLLVDDDAMDGEKRMGGLGSTTK